MLVTIGQSEAEQRQTALPIDLDGRYRERRNARSKLPHAAKKGSRMLSIVPPLQQLYCGKSFILVLGDRMGDRWQSKV